MIESRGSGLDRRLVAAVVVLAVYVVAFLIPMVHRLQAAETAWQQTRDDWDKVRGQLAEYRKLRAAVPPAAPAGSVVPALQMAASSVGISQDHIAILRPMGGDTTAELKFESLPGDTLVKFIHRVQAAGLKIQSFQMVDFQQSGYWTLKAVVSTS